MSPAIDDTPLMAYLDGELDAQAASEVEAAMASDPEVMDKLRGLALADAMVRASTSRVMHGSMPALTVGPRAVAVRSGYSHRPRTDAGRHPTRWRPSPLAVAASVGFLLLGSLAGYLVGERGVWTPASRELARSVSDESVARATFARVLETELSGSSQSWVNPETRSRGSIMPVRTWRDASGQYCREFEALRSVGESQSRQYGVACRRQDGTWRVRLRYYDDGG